MLTCNSANSKSNKIEDGICAGELPQAVSSGNGGWMLVIAAFMIHVVGTFYIFKGHNVIINVRILFEFIYEIIIGQLMEL